MYETPIMRYATLLDRLSSTNVVQHRADTTVRGTSHRHVTKPPIAIHRAPPQFLNAMSEGRQLVLAAVLRSGQSAATRVKLASAIASNVTPRHVFEPVHQAAGYGTAPTKLGAAQ